MGDRDLRRTGEYKHSQHDLLQSDGFRKSIFPVFKVDAPMPADTAVPGSFEPENGAASVARGESPAGRGREKR